MLWHAGLGWAGKGASWEAGLGYANMSFTPFGLSVLRMAWRFLFVQCSFGVSG